MNRTVLTSFTIFCFLSTVFLLGLSFNIQMVGASGTIYVRADGSIDPPTANITNVGNVTYTFTDNINDSIVIQRDNIVVDGAGYAVKGEGAYHSTGIYLEERINVTMKNMGIEDFEGVLSYGIWLNKSSNNIISGNNITNNENGIYFSSSSNNIISGNNMKDNPIGIQFEYSSNNTIHGNTLTNNCGGIWLDHSSNNIISRNNITDRNLPPGVLWLQWSNDNNISANNIINNHRGIALHTSSNNVLRKNNMTHNHYNLDISGYGILHFIQDIDKSNTVNGKPVYYWINKRDKTVPSDVGYVALINCTNITIQRLNLTNNGQGTLLAFTTNSTITKNNIKNNYRGIQLTWSSKNIISGNNITNNGDGATLLHSPYSTVSRNNIRDNLLVGIVLCSNTTVSGNNITNNDHGIYFAGVFGNIIFGNSITKNNLGIFVGQNRRTKIYHNNFVDNTEHVLIYPAYDASWDNGVEGNHWSNYNGADSDHDGIGDSWHEIDSNDIDHYPLMGIFSRFNTSVGDVYAICNSTISDFHFNGTAILFDVSGENGAAGFCRICIPKALMNETYRVLVNGTEILPAPLPLPCSNNTHTYLYFTYNHSTQEVIIIPEFPSFLILPLFMIATLLAVIVYKRNHST